MRPSDPKPPKWADRFLEWYCRPELLEEIQGDVYELFGKRFREKGLTTARRFFIWDVLRSFRLSTVKHVNLKPSPDMIKNNFKIAWRRLARQKMYSAIKIGGFALGIAACLLIALFIRDELSYDRYYPDADRIYRLVGVNREAESDGKGVDFPAPFAQALRDEFPEIERIGRINPNTLFTGGGNSIRRADESQNSYEEGFTFADAEMLDILKIPMVYGDREHALAEPNTVVLSKRKADRYFPNENPVGKTIIVNDNEEQPVTIGGVMQDFPANSHLQFDFLLTLKGREFYSGEQSNWNASNYHTYILLRPDADVARFEEKLYPLVFDKYIEPLFRGQGMPEANIEKMKRALDLELQPVSDIHLYSDDIQDGFSKGDIRFVWLFGAVALFILVIAGINFINLSTARSANRAREVGLRKVVGSYRSDLIGQFLTESVLLSYLSFVLGVTLARLLLPYFNQVAGKSLTLPWETGWLAPVLAGAALVVGLLAGLYPAFYLSAFKPIDVLKGKLSLGGKNAALRGTLVVFQFTTSIVLLIGTFIISRQMHFILHKKLGFDKEQVVLLQGTQTLGDKIPAFKERLLQLPDVQGVTVSDYMPVSGAGAKRNGNEFWEEGTDQNDHSVNVQIWRVDEDYLQTMGMTIETGRNFSAEMPTDSQAVIINRTLADKLHFDQPIGKRITNGWQHRQIIGVVEDFHFASLRENIGGMCLVLGSSPSITAVRVRGADMTKTIQRLTGVWKSFAPDQPIRYTFLDDAFANMYDDVRRTGRIFVGFAVFAIFVACLGLFALSAFMAEQRTREIGIRKVLGASVANILRLLTQSFLRLVLISLLLGSPLAWYLMHQWLNDFAYRIDIGMDVFIVAGLMVALIALLTISYQAVRTAMSNPVDALRSE